MEKFIDFVGNNYAWFLTITIILLFALIGYIVDTKKSKNSLFVKNENEIDEEAIENLIVPEGKSLAETVNVSKNINKETKNIELSDDSILKEDVLEEDIQSP